MSNSKPNVSAFADNARTKDGSQDHSVEFGARIVARAAELGMSQSDLAKASGVGAKLINTYWHGKRMPSATNLGLLARALGVDPIWLAVGVTDDGLGAMKSPVGSPEWVLIPFFSFDDVPLPGEKVEAKPREIPVRRAWLDRLGPPRGTYWSTEMPVDGLRGLADTGDLLICEMSSEQLRDGASYIFMMFNTRIVRRAVMTPGGIALVSDDESVAAVHLPADTKHGHLPNATCLGRIAAVYKMVAV